MNSKHSAVLVKEIVHWLAPSGTKTETASRSHRCLLLDGTLGGGGHAEALLGSSEQFFLVGLDRDPLAIRRSSERLAKYRKRIHLHCGNFAAIEEILGELPKEIVDTIAPNTAASFPLFDRILIDLGISSDQLDDPARGFSFAVDAPLDMRMDPSTSRTAADILNHYSARDLERMFLRGGVNKPLARSLAHTVIKQRPVTRTTEFAEICRHLSPDWLRKRKGLSSQHPATIPFQALRIEVNEELQSIRRFLDTAPELLSPGGRLAVISFHSGEDKLVTGHMRKWSRTEAEPKDLPIRTAKPAPGKLLTKKAVLPSLSEVEENSRARSARLRVFEKGISNTVGVHV